MEGAQRGLLPLAPHRPNDHSALQRLRRPPTVAGGGVSGPGKPRPSAGSGTAMKARAGRARSWRPAPGDPGGDEDNPASPVLPRARQHRPGRPPPPRSGRGGEHLLAFDRAGQAAGSGWDAARLQSYRMMSTLSRRGTSSPITGAPGSSPATSSPPDVWASASRSRSSSLTAASGLKILK